VAECIIKQQVTDAMKLAMRERQKERLAATRLIQAAFKQKEVDDRIEITDQIALVIFDKMIKQRRDSIDQYEKANRNDLAEKEQFEISVIQEFMPKALEHSEVVKLVEMAIANTNASSMKDMARIMEVLKPEVQGRADMSEVSRLVKDKLAK
jgi:uncharacterized protein YqeY